MIGYSVYLWKSPLVEDSVEKAYAKNQVSKVLSFDEFVKHIAEHNGVFSRGTVKGVVSDTCTCLVEMLLNGFKVEFGELGTFGISLSCEPADTLKDFSADNIKEVNIVFTPGKDFENLCSRAEFVPVASRAAQAATLKAEKSGKTMVDLAAAKNKGTAAGGSGENPDDGEDDSTDSDNTGGTPTQPGTGGGGGSSEDGGEE